MPIGAPPQPTRQPDWWPLLTPAMRALVLGWLRVRKYDTSSWSK